MIDQFKGIRNDIGSKHIEQEFFYDAVNFNNDSIIGADSISYPSRINHVPYYSGSGQTFAYSAALEYDMQTDTAIIDHNVQINTYENIVIPVSFTVDPGTPVTIDWSKGLSGSGNGTTITYTTYSTTNNPTLFSINNRNVFPRYYGFTASPLALSWSELGTSGVNAKSIVLSFWADMVVSAIGGSLRYISPASGAGLYVIQGSNYLSFQQNDGTNSSTQFYTVTGTPGTMQNYCCIMDSGVVSLYINGVLQIPAGTVAHSTVDFNLTTQYIASSNGVGTSINAAIYDLAILNYQTLIGRGETSQTIANNMYNNTFKQGRFLFAYEFPQYGSQIDGLFEYRYLDANGLTQTQEIACSGGNVFRDWDSIPVKIYSGMTPGICQFVVSNNQLLIVNGKDYPLWYNGETGNFYQMGAPEAVPGSSGGLLSGTYKYALTYITGNVTRRALRVRQGIRN
jgi:hypothetical protein